MYYINIVWYRDCGGKTMRLLEETSAQTINQLAKSIQFV